MRLDFVGRQSSAQGVEQDTLGYLFLEFIDQEMDWYSL